MNKGGLVNQSKVKREGAKVLHPSGVNAAQGRWRRQANKEDSEVGETGSKEPIK